MEKFEKALEEIGYDDSEVLVPTIFYIPGIEDKYDKVILEEGLEKKVKAVVAIYQKTVKYRKIYILAENNNEAGIEKYIKEFGFLPEKNTKNIENVEYSELKLKCVASSDTQTFKIQSSAIERWGIFKFVITEKQEGKENYTSLKPTENQPLPKDTNFFVRALVEKDIIADNNYTLMSTNKELAKCSKEDALE